MPRTTPYPKELPIRWYRLVDADDSHCHVFEKMWSNMRKGPMTLIAMSMGPCREKMKEAEGAMQVRIQFSSPIV